VDHDVPIFSFGTSKLLLALLNCLIVGLSFWVFHL
jgi:hypothetical protein